MKRLLLLLPVLLWSCSRSTKTEPPSAAAEPTPPSSSAPASTPSAAPSAHALRPPQGSPSREEREKAAFALLSGQKSAAALPLAATDPKETFNPQLRKELQASAGASVKLDPASEGSEAILRGAQASRGRLLRCYRAGVSRNPNLQGRIQAKITLSPGKPALVENAGSDLPDAGVVGCALDVLGRTAFPDAEGKATTLTIRFSPG